MREMAEFLILRLNGPMQAWGKHTFETFRPSELFPTRSGLVGLLGACLGIDRRATANLRALSDGFTFAVRVDAGLFEPRKLTDFHTIKNARGVQPGKWKEQEISRREYLCDARFTLALDVRADARYDAHAIREAVRQPHFTPFLGRRCCPLSAPLLDDTVGHGGLVEAEDLHMALAAVPPHEGTVYSELERGAIARLTVRDVPMFGKERQFATRPVFVHARESASETVPEQT